MIVYKGLLSLQPLFLPTSSSTNSQIEGGGMQSTGSGEKLATTTASSLLERLGDTFDFGVVAVYSCPNSCTVQSSGTHIHNKSNPHFMIF